jgi:hypothetical protein
VASHSEMDKQALNFRNDEVNLANRIEICISLPLHGDGNCFNVLEVLRNQAMDSLKICCI